MNKENIEPTSCDINAKNSCCNSETSNNDLKTHWDNVYENSLIDRLGWFEENPIPSLQLIKKSGVTKNAAILNVGAGATTLVDELINQDFKNILVNDISPTALEKLKKRLGNQSENIKWIVDDLTNPTELNNLEKIDLWYDRAVLHFFNDTKEQDSYFNLVRNIVKENGFVIIATFNLNGATKCSGLPVYRYDEKMIQEKLGNEFKLVESFDYTYTMPSNDTREYIYTLFKRK
jgi:SAM-dependent methyltransferase